MNKSMRLGFTAKSAAFTALMTLNFSAEQYGGFPAGLSINLNSAVACPDDVSDCMVVTPDENDRIDTGSGGGLVFGGGSSAGGGTVGSGGGSGSGSGSGGSAGDTSLGKSQQEIESCKADFQQAKSHCINMASNRRIAKDDTDCGHLLDYSITFLGVTVHFNEKTDCLTRNNNIYQNDVAGCNAAYTRAVANTCY